MESIRKIKLFISCPGDITNEIDTIKLVVNGINKTSGKQNGFIIDILHWDEDTYTEIGEDGQDVINKQIKYDILVGLLWLKTGTPTKREKSGTIEEINRALKNNKVEQLIYFKTSLPDSLEQIDPKSLQKVKDYKEELMSNGVLIKQFDSIEKFDSLFQINLSNLIADKLLPKIYNDRSQEIKSINNKKDNSDFSEIRNLISEIENSDILDIDVFSIADEVTSYLDTITSSMEVMTGVTETLTNNLIKRTNEINSIQNIKDNRLKQSKSKKTINLLSKELKEHNEGINTEIPIFSENLLQLGNSYSQLILTSNSLEPNDDSGLRSSMLDFRNSLQYVMESTASLLKEIMKWPPLNKNFNESKRETEVTLKNLMKEFLDGILIFDESIKNGK